MRLPPGDLPGGNQRRDGRAGDHRRHRAHVGAQPAPAEREREHPAADREAPDAGARRGGRERAAEPEQPDRGERDLELVADAEEARARAPGSGPSSERRSRSEPSARSATCSTTATAAGSSDRPRPRPQAVGRERERAAAAGDDQRPRPSADGASAPVSSSTVGSHIAASSTSACRAAVRRAARARQARRCSDRPDQAQPDHGPAARAEIREPVAQLARARPGCARRVPRSARPSCRRGPPTPSRSSTVGATSVEITRPSVRVESERSVVPPAQPGRAHRDEPPRDVARVLDHEHEVRGARRADAGPAQLPAPGGPGASLTTSRSVVRHSARAASATRSGSRRAPRARRGPRGPPRRSPPGCARAAVPRSRRAARGPDGRRQQAGHDVGRRASSAAIGDRGHDDDAPVAGRAASIRRHLVVVERGPRARARAHVEQGLLGRVGALDRRHEAERVSPGACARRSMRGRLRQRLRPGPEDDRGARSLLSRAPGATASEREHQSPRSGLRILVVGP